MIKLFPARERLVRMTFRLGTGKSLTIFYTVIAIESGLPISSARLAVSRVP
jgi:hypothetical protein